MCLFWTLGFYLIEGFFWSEKAGTWLVYNSYSPEFWNKSVIRSLAICLTFSFFLLILNELKDAARPFPLLLVSNWSCVLFCHHHKWLTRGVTTCSDHCFIRFMTLDSPRNSFQFSEYFERNFNGNLTEKSAFFIHLGNINMQNNVHFYLYETKWKSRYRGFNT